MPVAPNHKPWLLAAIVVSAALHYAFLYLAWPTVGYGVDPVFHTQDRFIVHTVRPVAAPTPAAQTVSGPTESAPNTAKARQATDTTPADSFYPPSALTQQPRIQSAVNLDTPEILANASGDPLILQIWIDAQGNVVRITRKPSAASEALFEAVKAVFLQAVFKPGEIDGKPVPSVIEIEIQTEGTGLEPS